MSPDHKHSHIETTPPPKLHSLALLNGSAGDEGGGAAAGEVESPTE